MTIRGGGRFEEIGGYSRVKRIGDLVFVAGTTAIEPSGRLYAPGDTYLQTRFVLARIADLLVEAGADLGCVVRTRSYLAEISTAGEFARAHGEVFAGIEPVATAVKAGLTIPGMMVEVEVDAIVREGAPTGSRYEDTPRG